MKSSAFRPHGLCSSMKSGLLASTFLATRRWMGLARCAGVSNAQSNAGASNAHSRASRGRSLRKVSSLLWAASILSAFVTGSAFAAVNIDNGGIITICNCADSDYESPWNIAGELFVGRDSTGTLNITFPGIDAPPDTATTWFGSGTPESASMFPLVPSTRI